ncbi:MAG: hypothetical protein AAGI92_01270 [Pseudomonadota bacterium]
MQEERATRHDPLDGGSLIAVQCPLIVSMKPVWPIDRLAKYRKALKSLIASCVRHDDYILQLSRGNFAIYLPGASIEQAQMVADRILAASVLAECEFGNHDIEEMPVNIKSVKSAPPEFVSRLVQRMIFASSVRDAQEPAKSDVAA